jgi:signal transduction histidine kinase
LALQTFLEWFTHGAIVLLAILTVVQWLRWRDRVSLDIALVFGTLALVTLLELSSHFVRVEAEWLRTFGLSVFLAHPFLLLRVVSHFRPVSRALKAIAFAGVVFSILSLWLAEQPFQRPALIVPAAAYFVLLLEYVASVFRRGARAAGGVTHWRMIHATWGAFLLSVGFVLGVLIALFPRTSEGAAAFIPLAALGSALNYYVAFAPPAWLRRLWQSSELYGLLAETSERRATPTEDEILKRLCGFVMSAVGANGAAVALWEDERKQLITRLSRWGYLEPGRPVPEGRLLDAWRGDTAMLVRNYEWVLPGGRPGSVYVVPIPSAVAPRGLLFVVLPKGALFVTDDLALLRVCCRETAVQLDNVTMLAQQRTLIGDLATRTDQLTALNKELEAFSYSVSHDLRAPLRHIAGFTELLQKSKGPALDEPRRRYLRLVSEAAVRMGELIDSLLVFSRMGRAEMLQTQVDLGAIVRVAQRDVSEADPNRTVRWVVRPLPHVTGDPSMLQLVFTNLLSNAFKYTRNRQDARIEVGWSDAPDEVIVFVRDNGVGFDMAYADRLFGVFQRLHRAEEFEGTGIGLANVQRIVARHGGRVWAQSAPEEGATFFVALPKH